MVGMKGLKVRRRSMEEEEDDFVLEENAEGVWRGLNGCREGVMIGRDGKRR